MSKTPKNTRLKGLRLYNFLVRQIKEENQKSKGSLQLSIRKRREIASSIYAEIKANGGRYNKAKITSKFRGIVKGLPIADVACNPNTLDTKYLDEFEFYSLDSYIQSLPDCLNVKVSTDNFGSTKIFNTKSYDYNNSGTYAIVEDIRISFPSSGEAYFQPIVKLRPNKKPDINNGDNYFLDLVLIEGNANPSISAPTSIPVSKPASTSKVSKKLAPTVKKKLTKNKPLGTKNAKFKIENKTRIEEINRSYEKQFGLLNRQFKMGILSKPQLNQFKKEIIKERNEELKRLPKK